MPSGFVAVDGSLSRWLVVVTGHRISLLGYSLTKLFVFQRNFTGMPSKRWTSGSGYDGLFGDSFFSDCYRIVDGSSGQSSRRKHIIHEDVTTDISEDRVKPWFRKTNLSRISDDDIYQVQFFGLCVTVKIKKWIIIDPTLNKGNAGGDQFHSFRT